METPKTRAFMEEYIKNAKIGINRVMWGYWEAYRARRVNNHHVLVEVAEELAKHGYECYGYELDYNSECLHSMQVRKGNFYTMVGFAEVPYRWYVGVEYEEGGGLVRGVYVGESGWDFPFEIDEIIEYMGRKMKPIDERFRDVYKVKIA